MLGAIYGDTVGSVYEFDNIKTKDFPLFIDYSEFTDDSVMTVAVAEALLRLRDRNDLAAFRQTLISVMHHYGELYPFAGYGGRFAVWLGGKRTKPYGSYGNGSAMRVSPVAWYAESLAEALTLAKASADITHDHPEGIKGAECTAGAIFLARTGASREQIRNFVCGYYDIGFTLEEIRPTYRFNETCQKSVPQAMVAFLESTDFEDTVRNAVSIGGDSDTIAAIAGSVAEGFYGMTPQQKEDALSRLAPHLRTIADIFAARYM